MSWLRIQKAAAYADVSPRTIRRWLHEGLRHSRVSGVPYISEQAVDEWMQAHEVQEDRAQLVVDEVMADL
jgi:excisionase family DNA binding protein